VQAVRADSTTSSSTSLNNLQRALAVRGAPSTSIVYDSGPWQDEQGKPHSANEAHCGGWQTGHTVVNQALGGKLGNMVKLLVVMDGSCMHDSKLNNQGVKHCSFHLLETQQHANDCWRQSCGFGRPRKQ
jgi:hypothetical protein